MPRHKPTGAFLGRDLPEPPGVGRRRSSPSMLPLSRATVQMWGFEQTGRSIGRERAARRPVRTVVRWIAATFRH